MMIKYILSDNQQSNWPIHRIKLEQPENLILTTTTELNNDAKDLFNSDLFNTIFYIPQNLSQGFIQSFKQIILSEISNSKITHIWVNIDNPLFYHIFELSCIADKKLIIQCLDQSHYEEKFVFLQSKNLDQIFWDSQSIITTNWLMSLEISVNNIFPAFLFPDSDINDFLFQTKEQYSKLNKFLYNRQNYSPEDLVEIQNELSNFDQNKTEIFSPKNQCIEYVKPLNQRTNKSEFESEKSNFILSFVHIENSDWRKLLRQFISAYQVEDDIALLLVPINDSDSLDTVTTFYDIVFKWFSVENIQPESLPEIIILDLKEFQDTILPESLLLFILPDSINYLTYIIQSIKECSLVASLSNVLTEKLKKLLKIIDINELNKEFISFINNFNCLELFEGCESIHYLWNRSVFDSIFSEEVKTEEMKYE